MMAEQLKRQIAVKIGIGELLARIEHQSTEQIMQQGLGRVNIIASIVDKQEGTVALDDGSGKITGRSFDQPEVIANAQIGKIVLVIGKPRTYNNEPYLVPEIIRPLSNNRWVEVRLRELKQNVLPIIKRDQFEGDQFKKGQPSQEEMQERDNKDDKKIAMLQEGLKNQEQIKEGMGGISIERVISAMKELDQGEGVVVEDILARLGKEAEPVIESLVVRGEIFQLRAGIVKVLE